MATIGPLLVLASLTIGAALLASCLWSLRIARGAARLVPPVGRFVPVRGGVLHVVEDGDSSANPVVLIHGLSGQLQHFTYAMTDKLAGRTRVIALDRPGCGHSTRDSDAEASLAAQARMIWECLDALEVRRPILCGHSLGGAVVLAMALSRPMDTAALVLLAPYTHPVRSHHPALRSLGVRSSILRRLIGYTIAVPLARRTARSTLDGVFAPEPWPNDFVTRAGGALGLRPKGFVTAAGDFVAAADEIGIQAQRYRELDLPGAVLLASDDALLATSEQGAPLGEIGFSVDMLDGRGHMLPIMAPEDCTRLILRALDQVKAAE